MRIAPDSGAGAGARAIANAGVVALCEPIGYAERRASLGYSDPGKLPTTKQSMSKSAAALEERQAVDIADRQVVAQVEIRAGPICGYIIGINERVVGAVRGIVNGVAV